MSNDGPPPGPPQWQQTPYYPQQPYDYGAYNYGQGAPGWGMPPQQAQHASAFGPGPARNWTSGYPPPPGYGPQPVNPASEAAPVPSQSASMPLEAGDMPQNDHRGSLKQKLPPQIVELLESFAKNDPNPGRDTIAQMAQDLYVDESKIADWFVAHKARTASMPKREPGMMAPPHSDYGMQSHMPSHSAGPVPPSSASAPLPQPTSQMAPQYSYSGPPHAHSMPLGPPRPSAPPLYPGLSQYQQPYPQSQGRSSYPGYPPQYQQAPPPSSHYGSMGPPSQQQMPSYQQMGPQPQSQAPLPPMKQGHSSQSSSSPYPQQQQQQPTQKPAWTQSSSTTPRTNNPPPVAQSGNPRRSKMLRANGVVIDLENIQFVSPLSGVLKAMRDRIWELEVEIQRLRGVIGGPEDDGPAIKMSPKSGNEAYGEDWEGKMSLRPSGKRRETANGDGEDDEDDFEEEEGGRRKKR